MATEQNLRARYLVTCRLYLDRHPDHPFFADWRELAHKQDAEGVKQHYAPLFADALKDKKGDAYDAQHGGFLRHSTE